MKELNVHDLHNNPYWQPTSSAEHLLPCFYNVLALALKSGYRTQALQTAKAFGSWRSTEKGTVVVANNMYGMAE
jgi:hypothetical protein